MSAKGQNLSVRRALLPRREKIMSDNKQNVGGQDRSRVAGDEPYEVDYFAQKHGITPAKARKLIETYGNDRKRLDAEAAKLG
jgi:hypothetical protein